MKIKERERNLPNLPMKPTWRPKWPAQPTRPSFCRLPPPRPEAARWRVPTPPRPPPASTWEPRAFYQRHGDARRPCPLSLTRFSLSPPLALSLELIQAQPSPPTSARAAAAIPKPLRHALELRRIFLILSTELHGAGRPRASPRRRLQPPDAGDLHRRPACSGLSPKPLTNPAEPL